MRKCSECRYNKEIVYRKGVVDRLYVKVCTKETPEMLLALYEGSVDSDKWNNCKCIMEESAPS